MSDVLQDNLELTPNSPKLKFNSAPFARTGTLSEKHGSKTCLKQALQDTVEKLKYEIIKPLSKNDSIRRRGTACWHGLRGGADYATWFDVSRLHPADIRSIIGNVENYPRQDWYENAEVRKHRRLVTTPVAKPLATFRSKKELLQVLVCAIQAHRRLVEKHILHRDISLHNVMIWRRPMTERDTPSSSSAPVLEGVSNEDPSALSPPPTRTNDEFEDNKCVRGILVDLDYAIVTQYKNGKKFERTSHATSHRIGTLPFMSTEILMGLPPGKEHEPHHDLESFFIVFLWTTLIYAGPRDVKQQDIDIETEDPIKGWLEGKTIRQLGLNKYGFMSHPDDWFFEATVTDKCTLYFKDLIPCIHELRRALFTGNPADRASLTHQHIIDIFGKYVAKFPDDDNWTRKNDEAGYGKGKFEDIQEANQELEAGEE